MSSRRQYEERRHYMECDERPWRSTEDSLAQLTGVFLRVIARMAATKMIHSLNCCTHKCQQCKGQKEVVCDHCNHWPTTGRGEHPICTPELPWQPICIDREDNCVAFKRQIRGALFRMPPAGWLISRGRKKNISGKHENCWANLLQVRLSGSCYATHWGRLESCWSWVGSSRSDWKLRADWVTDRGK